MGPEESHEIQSTRENKRFVDKLASREIVIPILAACASALITGFLTNWFAQKGANLRYSVDAPSVFTDNGGQTEGHFRVFVFNAGDAAVPDVECHASVEGGEIVDVAVDKTKYPLLNVNYSLSDGAAKLNLGTVNPTRSLQNAVAIAFKIRGATGAAFTPHVAVRGQGMDGLNVTVEPYDELRAAKNLVFWAMIILGIAILMNLGLLASLMYVRRKIVDENLSDLRDKFESTTQLLADNQARLAELSAAARHSIQHRGDIKLALLHIYNVRQLRSAHERLLAAKGPVSIGTEAALIAQEAEASDDKVQIERTLRVLDDLRSQEEAVAEILAEIFYWRVRLYHRVGDGEEMGRELAQARKHCPDEFNKLMKADPFLSDPVE